MLNRLSRLVAGILIAGSLTSLVWAQAPAAPAKDWKDQGESDIGLAAQKEPDPVKKLDLLKKWEQQYPETAFKDDRTLMTASALLTILGQAAGKPAGDPAIAAGQKAGKQLVDNFDNYFAPSVKPAQLSDAQWADAKKQSALQIHGTLANIAQTSKDDATAEAEYKKVLGIDPMSAVTSYYLGATVIREMIATKNPARYSEAIYDYARSLAVTGPTALPAAGKAAADAALKKYYSNYHGNTDGIDDVIKQASTSALPPDGFHLLSIVDIQEAKDKDHAAWAAAHPDLDFWETIKSALTTQGDTFFTNLKDVGFPPPNNGATPPVSLPAMFKANVISSPNSKQLLVSVDNVPTGDALLKFDDNIKGDVPAGTSIQFKGVVDAYTKDPSYVLTLVIQEPKTDIVGLPDGVTFVPDAAAKPKPGAKAGTGKAPVKAPVKKAAQ